MSKCAIARPRLSRSSKFKVKVPSFPDLASVQLSYIPRLWGLFYLVGLLAQPRIPSPCLSFVLCPGVSS